MGIRYLLPALTYLGRSNPPIDCKGNSKRIKDAIIFLYRTLPQFKFGLQEIPDMYTNPSWGTGASTLNSYLPTLQNPNHFTFTPHPYIKVLPKP